MGGRGDKLFDVLFTSWSSVAKRKIFRWTLIYTSKTAFLQKLAFSVAVTRFEPEAGWGIKKPPQALRQLIKPEFRCN